jgi:16S rRNA (cytosine1402-N4)-methyltransferase
MSKAVYHQPVLLEACLEALQIKADGIYVDCTLGGGGHSRAILGRLGPKGRLFGIDQDQDAIVRANQPLEDGTPALCSDPRFGIIDANFSQMQRFLQWKGVQGVHGILADLGVSSHHLDEAERGFAFRFEEAPLDMRMDRRSGFDARAWLAVATEEDMASVFFRYGEIRQSRRLARDLVMARLETPFETAGQLRETALKSAGKEKPSRYLARVFQAIRIHLNRELESLQALLEQSALMLIPGGRLAVLSYHSLEDRLVKNFINHGNFEGKDYHDLYGNALRPLDPVKGRWKQADAMENYDNPRARSAKLRAGIRNQVTTDTLDKVTELRDSGKVFARLSNRPSDSAARKQRDQHFGHPHE